MLNWLLRGASRPARIALVLAGLACAGGAHAWSATRLPDVTLSGSQMNAHVDLNRDGRMDLISTGPGTARRGFVEVRYNTSKGFAKKADWRYDGPVDWAQVYSSPMAIDVNGDGWPDLIVGAQSWSGTKQNAGAALVFFGGPNGFPAQPSQVIEGPEEGSLFGFTMRPLGDFNGDGFADLAVSANTAGGTEGKIFIYTGSRQGLVNRPESTLSFEGLSWWYFGLRFDAGPLTATGSSAIVVGMPTAINQGRPGLVAVYQSTPSGFANKPSELLVAPDDFTVRDSWGASVAVLGDVDGDGYNEIAVAATDVQHGGSVGDVLSSGQIHVYYGSANGFANSARKQTLTPPDADGFGFFGEVMLGQRDFNGDGYADLIVGASMRQRGLQGTSPFPGFLWIYTGGPGGFTKAPYKRSGPANSVDGLGASIDAADVTGDGQMDIITANPAAPSDPQGTLRVFRGAKGLK